MLSRDQSCTKHVVVADIFDSSGEGCVEDDLGACIGRWRHRPTAERR